MASAPGWDCGRGSRPQKEATVSGHDLKPHQEAEIALSLAGLRQRLAGLGFIAFAVCQFKHLFKVQTINLLPYQAEVHLAVAIRVVQRCQWGVELGQLDCQQGHDKFLLVMGVQLRHESDDILLGRLCTAAVEDYGVGGSAAAHQAGQNDSNYYILHELTSVFSVFYFRAGL